jgi:hypothetical protein
VEVELVGTIFSTEEACACCRREGCEAAAKRLCADDGFRIDPPASSPVPATTKSPATAAVPVEAPPGDQFWFRMWRGSERRHRLA